MRLNKQLSKQSRRRWFETPWPSLWRHCNGSQAIAWTSNVRLPVRSFGARFVEMRIMTQWFSLPNMYFKMSSTIWCPFCSGPSKLEANVPTSKKYENLFWSFDECCQKAFFNLGWILFECYMLYYNIWLPFSSRSANRILSFIFSKSICFHEIRERYWLKWPYSHLW